MNKILLLLFIFITSFLYAQMPYAWVVNTDPGWTSSNPTVNTLAYQTNATRVGTSDYNNGTSSWYTYNNSQKTTYTSPTYNFACSSQIVISFRIDINLETRYDWLYFQYSTNGGTTWINPVAQSASINSSSVDLSTYSPLTTYVDNNSNTNGWTGSITNTTFSYNVAGTTTFKYRFIFESDGSVNTDKWADILAFTTTCAIPLPIELISFTGKPEDRCNEIKWSTASEVNNDFFTLEKTLDGENYEILTIMNGAGNSSNSRNYQYDEYLPDTLTYYRLKQTDYDGKYVYSDLISVYRKEDESKHILKIINLLGQEVDDSYDGVKIYYFSDGTYIKKF